MKLIQNQKKKIKLFSMICIQKFMFNIKSKPCSGCYWLENLLENSHGFVYLFWLHISHTTESRKQRKKKKNFVSVGPHRFMRHQNDINSVEEYKNMRSIKVEHIKIVRNNNNKWERKKNNKNNDTQHSFFFSVYIQKVIWKWAVEITT